MGDDEAIFSLQHVVARNGALGAMTKQSPNYQGIASVVTGVTPSQRQETQRHG